MRGRQLGSTIPERVRAYLYANRGRVVTYAELADHVYGDREDGAL